MVKKKISGPQKRMLAKHHFIIVHYFLILKTGKLGEKKICPASLEQSVPQDNQEVDMENFHFL